MIYPFKMKVSLYVNNNGQLVSDNDSEVIGIANYYENSAFERYPVMEVVEHFNCRCVVTLIPNKRK
jgi:hypothetical protein